MFKPNERKPRRHRQKADTTTAESAENEAMLLNSCIQTINKTEMVSEPLQKQLATACNLN